MSTIKSICPDNIPYKNLSRLIKFPEFYLFNGKPTLYIMFINVKDKHSAFCYIPHERTKSFEEEDMVGLNDFFKRHPDKIIKDTDDGL